jgi:DNA repair protein RadC
MRSALLFSASALIFVHNHPSGNTEPSLCDKEITRDLQAAAHTLQIKVLDHVIVGPEKTYFSFADQGFIDDNDLAIAGRR